MDIYISNSRKILIVKAYYAMIKRILILIFFVIHMNSMYANILNNIHYADTTVVNKETETYTVYRGEKNLYISIKTFDHKIARSILRRGIHIYINNKGKKKKNVSITYPLIKENKPPLRKSEDFNHEREEIPDPDVLFDQISHMIDKDLPQNAIYSFYDYKKEFNILLNNEKITIDISVNKEENSFNYEVEIPKKLIHEESDKNLDKLMIGIETVKNKRNRNDQERSSRQSQRNVQRRGGNGGGALGGRQGNGRSNNRNQSQRTDGNNISSENGIEIWFKAL